MADDLLKLYFGDNATESPDAQSGSVMDLYFNKPTVEVAKSTEEMVPRLDTSSGQAKLVMIPKSQVEAEQKKQQEEDTLLHHAKTAISDLGSSFGESYMKNLKSGVETAGQGTGELVTGSPVTGLSRIGLGTLGTVAAATSIPTLMEGAQSVLKKASGNPDFAEKATALGGLALPVKPFAAGIKSISPSSRAFKDLVDVIGVDKIPEVVAELKSNPRLTIPDVSLPAKMMTQKLVTTEGQHQSSFQKFIDQRVNSSKNAVEDIYNDTMGVPVNVLKKLNGFKQAAKDVGETAINPAVKGAGPVDVSDVVKSIDANLKPGVNSVISAGQALPASEIQNELKSVRDLLTNDKSVRTDAQSLHNIQSSLRARAEDLLNSPNGSERQKGYALMQLRNKIVDAIDTASPKAKAISDEVLKAHGYPDDQIANLDKAIKDKTAEVLQKAYGEVQGSKGTYREGLSKYRDEKDIESAFTKGYQITRNRPGQWTDRPEYWEEWVKQATPQEKAAAVEGARIAVDHQINAMRFGARRGTDIPEVEFNKQKLVTLLPGQDVDKMFKLLSDERKIAATNSDLVKNSQTAMRMKADSRVDLPTPKQLGMNTLLGLVAEIGGNLSAGVPGLGPATFAGLTGANYGKNKLVRSLAMQKNNELTSLLTASGADRDAVIKGLEGVLKQPRLSILNKAKLALPVSP